MRPCSESISPIEAANFSRGLDATAHLDRESHLVARSGHELLWSKPDDRVGGEETGGRADRGIAPMLRIGTWNVEYGEGAEKNRRRLRRLLEADADIWVLTETHDDLDLGTDFRCIATTPRQPRGQRARWTAIWSRLPIVKTVGVKDDNRTIAAIFESAVGALLVYGTVLPWQTDRGRDGVAPGWSEHHRVIPMQASEWVELRREHPGVALCVAGDLNVSLGGPHYYGTKRGREMLRTGLKEAGLVCVTETERLPRGLLRQPPIDHICVDDSLAARASVVAGWEGEDADGMRLSDHTGLVVRVETL